MIFNRGSAEPKGSASICQGFRGWPVKNKTSVQNYAGKVVETLYNPASSASDLHACVGFCCSKKVEKHWSST